MNHDAATVDIETTEDPSALAEFVTRLRAAANDENNPSGILHWSYFEPYTISTFDGAETRAVCDSDLWRQLHLDLSAGRRGGPEFASPDALDATLRPFHERDDVPIAVGHFRYETPRRAFVGSVLSSTRRGEAPPMPDNAERVLESGRAFFASAVLPFRTVEFTPLPPVHYGLDVRFVVPRDAYLTNVAGVPESLEIDFDDGHGYRAVAFDEPVSISYPAALPVHVRVRTVHADQTLVATFRLELRLPVAPMPDETWELVAVQQYAGRPLARGWAWVYRAWGKAHVENPVIFADGFGAGPSQLHVIWNILNEGSVQFAKELRDRGRDVIILGYADKSAYLQENAFLAVSAISKTISSRVGNRPLVTGGGSMGGVVTRYALAWMEKNGRDHQTDKYLSYDSPHNGAWVPLILQYMAHYYGNYRDAAKQLSDLVNSPAAQQLLWGHIPSWDYKGEVNKNALRLKFLEELTNLGWFPSRPRKYGVANGNGNGHGNGVPMGIVNVGYKYDCYSGDLCTQPEYGLNRRIGFLWVYGYSPITYSTNNIQSFDSAPGGTSTFFQLAGGALGVSPKYASTCFVPSLSAASIKPGCTGDLFANIGALDPTCSDLNEFFTSTTNTGHVEVTREIADWLLKRI